MDNQKITRAADNVRVLIAAMVEKAQSGHPGGAMGGADFVSALFSSHIIYDPRDPEWIARDRFFMDPGHMSPMLYGILALTGRYSMDELKEFRQWGSVTPGHPELDVKRGVENSSGPLGQGHVMARGMRNSRTCACSPVWRCGGTQDVCVYFRWRHTGRNFAGCWPDSRLSRSA